MNDKENLQKNNKKKNIENLKNSNKNTNFE